MRNRPWPASSAHSTRTTGAASQPGAHEYGHGSRARLNRRHAAAAAAQEHAAPRPIATPRTLAGEPCGYFLTAASAGACCCGPTTGDLRRPPAATAVRAPTTDMAAAAASAGRNPEISVADEPRCPFALNTAATIATPNTEPNRCSVFCTPEALPMSAGGTVFSAVVGTVGTAIEIPTPAMMSGSTNRP